MRTYRKLWIAAAVVLVFAALAVACAAELNRSAHSQIGRASCRERV